MEKVPIRANLANLTRSARDPEIAVVLAMRSAITVTANAIGVVLRHKFCCVGIGIDHVKVSQGPVREGCVRDTELNGEMRPIASRVELATSTATV